MKNVRVYAEHIEYPVGNLEKYSYTSSKSTKKVSKKSNKKTGIK